MLKSDNGLISRACSERMLPWLAAFLGTLLAAWVVFQAHGAINSDGIMYVEIARLFSTGQWQAGLNIANWPLYPIMVMIVHRLTGLDFQKAAHLLSILAFAIVGSGLTVLIRDVGGARRTMLAGMLMLFASPYIVGDVLPMVVRDQLFWAAHLWSLIFFIRYYQRFSLMNAWGWGVTAVFAVLLRVEALTYLVMLPLVLLVKPQLPWRNRWNCWLQANWVLLLIVAVIACAFILIPSLRLSSLGRLGEPMSVMQQVHAQFAHGLESKSKIFAENVLGDFLKDYAMSGLLMTLLFILMLKTVSVAGWPQFTAVIAGKSVKNNGAHKPLCSEIFCWLIILGLINCSSILVTNFLLSKRYLIPIGLIVLVYSAFGLTALHNVWQDEKNINLLRRGFFPGLVMVIILQLAATIWPNDSDKNPSLAAAKWLVEHRVDKFLVYYDSRRIRYYVNGDSSDRTEDEWPAVQQYLQNGLIRQFDYAVVRVARKNIERQEYLTQTLGAQPLAVFANGRGDRVLVYQVKR